MAVDNIVLFDKSCETGSVQAQKRSGWPPLLNAKVFDVSEHLNHPENLLEINLCRLGCLQLLSIKVIKERELETQVQIREDAVCVWLHTNTLLKPTVLLQAMSK